MFFPSRYFSKAEEDRIVEAIRKAESQTSGELRVHVARKHKVDIMTEAAKVFQKLGMDKTKERNGVLFFIVPQKRQFAVIGDKGINEKVPEGFWNEVRDLMQDFFKKGEITEGICRGITLAGHQLKQYFPGKDDDENELPDTVSYS